MKPTYTNPELAQAYARMPVLPKKDGLRMVRDKLRCLKRVVRQRQLGAYRAFLAPRFASHYYHQVDG